MQKQNKIEVKQICAGSGWAEIKTLPSNCHDPVFLNILNDFGFGNISIPVPLKKRYTKGRKWTAWEIDELKRLWANGYNLTFISAVLNRNPQDIIYKFIRGEKLFEDFSQKGRSEGSSNWTSAVGKCAHALFAEGLPAWKIATLFQVDFEYVEKKVFSERDNYGHVKKNPFYQHTQHKNYTNRVMLDEAPFAINSALELFCGHGIFTKDIIHKNIPHIVSIDSDEKIIERNKMELSKSQVNFICADNLAIIPKLKQKQSHFDLIDVDPFTTCHEQIPLIWDLMADRCLVGITFGGEYRRCFITSNRTSIKKRYGFDAPNLNNQEYFDAIALYFLGWVAKQAKENGYGFEVISGVRYANICRFWVYAEQKQRPNQWFKKVVREDDKGHCFLLQNLPKYKELKWHPEQYEQLLLGI